MTKAEIKNYEWNREMSTNKGVRNICKQHNYIPKTHIGNVGNRCSYGTIGKYKYDKQEETNDRQRSDKNTQGLKVMV
jgi:hypothetical protein